jgi:glycosyltransferase involved in cell wall biosynthesis
VRVLHLTPELPYWPGGSGGATRQFHLLRRLAELGHDVTVVAPMAQAELEGAAGLRAAGVRLEGVERPSSRVAETLGALAREPRLVPRAARLPVLAWQVSVFWARLRERALRSVREGAPDVVIVEHDNAAAWVADLPDTVPAVLELQNVGWHYYENRARAARGLARAASGAEARRFRRHDARWFSRYAALVAVSDRDREDLAAATSTPVETVPNGVAADELRPAAGDGEPDTLLFTGTLSHPPNAEGIRWFVEAAWPRVRAQRPEAKLLVVGRGPPPAVRRLDSVAGVEVVGPVPDVAPYFERARAVVAPLRSGGGTRLKILEALASGRALVSTAVGREGLDLQHSEHLLVADGAEDFAAATLQLLGDAGLRGRLREAGREAVERRYDWRVLGERLEAVLRDAGRA